MRIYIQPKLFQPSLYEGMTANLEFTPMNGVAIKDKPYKIIYSDDTTRVYYTLDGTTPTELSAQVTREVTVTGPATVTYKRISKRERYGKAVTGNFITGTLPPPVAKLRSAKPGGFKYSYYEGEGTKRPDLKSAKPIKTGLYNKDFNADSFPRKNNYAIVMDGFLEVKEDGYYIFFVRAGKGSSFSVAGQQIMHWDDNDKHEAFTYLLPLVKGFYPIHMESFDKKDDFNLLLYYMTPSMSPSGDPIPVPFDLIYTGKH